MHAVLLPLLTAALLTGVRAEPPLLEVDLRWVDQALPATSGAVTTAGLPRGPHTVSSAAAQAGVSAAGPVMRVQSGATAVWQLRQVPPLMLARTGAGDARGTRIELPLAGPAAEWRLEATPTLLARGQVRLQLTWQQPQEGGQAQWQTTLPLTLGRWAVVARSPAEPLAEPGTVRSRDTVHPSRELQVRVSPVLSPAE